MGLLDIGVMFYFLLLMFAANQVQAGQWERSTVQPLLFTLVGLLLVLALIALPNIFLGLIPSSETENLNLPPINGFTAFFATLLALGSAGGSYALITSVEIRQRLARFFGENQRYDAGSIVHTTALLLCIAVLVGTIVLFILAGGISGVAASIESSGISISDNVFQAALWVISAILGVGLFIRRDALQTLARLGLRLPNRDDWIIGTVVGVALFFGSMIFDSIWNLLVSSDLIAQQTQAAEQLSRLITTLPLAFSVAISAAVGEEIFMRGALQPVFGIWVTSAFFTLLHPQYLGTPTMLLIFAVSVSFGWLRARYSTTAALIGHFFYNFVPLFILVLLNNGGTPAP